MVVAKVLEGKGVNYGYNAQTGEYGDMVAMGVLDPPTRWSPNRSQEKAPLRRGFSFHRPLDDAVEPGE